MNILEEAIHRHSVGRALRAEKRLVAFMARTGLQPDEISLVSFDYGEVFPQWSGAVDLLPKSKVMLETTA